MSSDRWGDFEIEPTLASAVQAGRGWTRQTMRRLALASGVSAGQISRIESGQVERPSVETLLALAGALNHHPTPMLVLGGQLTGKPARAALAELIDEMRETTTDDEERRGLRELVDVIQEGRGPELRQVAIELLTYGSRSALWPETLARVAPSRLPDHDVLRRILDVWLDLTPDRRWRLAELAQDLRAASLAETATPSTPAEPEEAS